MVSSESRYPYIYIYIFCISINVLELCKQFYKKRKLTLILTVVYLTLLVVVLFITLLFNSFKSNPLCKSIQSMRDEQC